MKASPKAALGFSILMLGACDALEDSASVQGIGPDAGGAWAPSAADAGVAAWLEGSGPHGVAADGAAFLALVEFEGGYDAETGNFSIERVSLPDDSPLDLGGLGLVEQAIWCGLRVVADGAPGSNPNDSVELYTDPTTIVSAAPPAPAPARCTAAGGNVGLYPILGVFCADVRVMNFFSVPLTDVHVAIDFVGDETNYGPYAGGLGTSVVPPAGLTALAVGLPALDAVWSYGSLGARGAGTTASTRTWAFRYASGGGSFRFRGKVVSRVAEVCGNAVDEDCDGQINNACGTFGLDAACVESADCASGVCRAGVCVVTPALGTLCASDAECIPGTWCPTDTTQRRCSPRVDLGAGLHIPFQYVPGGTYTTGSPAGELGRQSNEGPVSVTLSRSVFVSRTEVTQAQWGALSGAVNPSFFQPPRCAPPECGPGADGTASWPVEHVDWYSAAHFANVLSVREGLQPCYTLSGCADPVDGWRDGQHDACTGAVFLGPSCEGYRLLTDAEWERAARAGTTSATYLGELTGANGDCVSPQLNLDGIAWWCRNSGAIPHPQRVATRVPNAWGLFDVLGNVWEWTSETDLGAPLGGVDPFVAVSTPAMRIRGGSCDYTAQAVRSAVRNDYVATGRGYAGVRLGRSGP